MTRCSYNYTENKRITPPLANIICCLIDRSASTIDMGGAPIFEMNSQLKILKKSSNESNVDIRFTLASFNEDVEYLMIYKDLKNEVIPTRKKFIEVFHPKGRSRLYTSILRCLQLLEKQRQDYIRNLPSPVSKLDPEVVTSLIILTDNIDIQMGEELKDKVQYTLKKSFNRGLRFKIIIANPYTKNIEEALNLKSSHIIQTECNYSSIRNTLKKLNSIIKNIDNEYTYI